LNQLVRFISAKLEYSLVRIGAAAMGTKTNLKVIAAISLAVSLALGLGCRTARAADADSSRGVPNSANLYIENDTGQQLDGSIQAVYAHNAHNLNRTDVSVPSKAKFRFDVDFDGGLLHIATAAWVVTFQQTAGFPTPILFIVEDRVSAGYTTSCYVAPPYGCRTNGDGVFSFLTKQ
jgi:hypothetical protein